MIHWLALPTDNYNAYTRCRTKQYAPYRLENAVTLGGAGNSRNGANTLMEWVRMTHGRKHLMINLVLSPPGSGDSEIITTRIALVLSPPGSGDSEVITVRIAPWYCLLLVQVTLK